jgi:hypothetical protein
MQPTQIESLTHLPDYARVWQYISNRKLTDAEVQDITAKAKVFCTRWTAHDQDLHADAWVSLNYILVIAVDETQAGATGCSIDKSTHFVEEMGKSLGVDFFVRDRVFYINQDNEVAVTTLSNIKGAAAADDLSAYTSVFDTAASSVGAFMGGWKQLGKTWMKRWL